MICRGLRLGWTDEVVIVIPVAGVPDGCWGEFGHEAGMIDLLECFSSAVICGVLRINAVKKL